MLPCGIHGNLQVPQKVYFTVIRTAEIASNSPNPFDEQSQLVLGMENTMPYGCSSEAAITIQYTAGPSKLAEYIQISIFANDVHDTVS